jgi:hypothetical protein
MYVVEGWMPGKKNEFAMVSKSPAKAPNTSRQKDDVSYSP